MQEVRKLRIQLETAASANQDLREELQEMTHKFLVVKQERDSLLS